jgi:S-adenosylmethionine synthetase
MVLAKHDFVFTSESVSEGHPDKVCDRISDAIVDTYLAAEPQARCGVETMATTNRIVLAGETRGPASITKDMLIDVARHAIRDIGYEQEGFHWQRAQIDCFIHPQSSDIALGVDAAGNKDEGAGDQGMMFGYACRETPELMPAPIFYAHAILRSLAEARHSGAASLLGPDAKSQVTLQYIGGKPVGATAVLVSAQHDPSIGPEEVREIVRPHVVNVLPEGWMCDEAHFYINPTGRFVIGGPDGDCGLTGRKIIVDTYGGAAPHGGGAFSGKDPTKVDRSAAYAASAKTSWPLAERCTIQVACDRHAAAVGLCRDRRHRVRSTRTSCRASRELMDLPRAASAPISAQRADHARTAYGHFGRAPEPGASLSLDLVRNRAARSPLSFRGGEAAVRIHFPEAGVVISGDARRPECTWPICEEPRACLLQIVLLPAASAAVGLAAPAVRSRIGRPI